MRGFGDCRDYGRERDESSNSHPCQHERSPTRNHYNRPLLSRPIMTRCVKPLASMDLTMNPYSCCNFSTLMPGDYAAMTCLRGGADIL